MKTLLNLLVVICLAVSPAKADDLSTSQAQNMATTPVATAEQAVERALEVTGFGRATYKQRSDPSEMAAKVVVTEDKTPFFHDSIENRTLWVVTFDSVYVDIPGLMPSWQKAQIPKTYDAYIDPNNGLLLKIESRYQGGDSTLSEEPAPDVAARDMQRNGVDFLDLVEVRPEIDFYEALRIATPCYGANAKQIIAQLAMCDVGGVQPRPVWSILGRGIPPFHGSGLGDGIVPIWAKNRMLCLVDASSGALIVMICGIPQVKPPTGWPVDSGTTDR